jgi:hypothetical protein
LHAQGSASSLKGKPSVPLATGFVAKRILLNAPASGRIGFCSSGFSQELKSAPVWIANQRLSAGTRALMINAKL